MIEAGPLLKVVSQGALALIAGFVAILLLLLPLEPGVGGAPMPDLLFCLMAYWVLRRPEGASLPVVFVLGLLADLMLGRPVGLGAFLMVVALEVLRAQAGALRDMSFWIEWLVVALLGAASILGTWLFLWITFSATPPAIDMLLLVILTAAAYPPVAGFCRTILGMRYPERRVQDRIVYAGRG